MARDIVETMRSYTEYSPSGKGLRILFAVPEDFPYDKTRYYINNQSIGLEVYIAGCTQKYVTVTGDTLTPGRDLEERGEQLKTVLEKYMVRPQATGARQAPTLPAPSPAGFQPLRPHFIPAVDLDDLALIELARQSKNGAAFSALWAGDTSAYGGDDSRADLALCNMLAFWTNRDAARMDRLPCFAAFCLRHHCLVQTSSCSSMTIYG